jgi:predicted transcriptional regulator
MKRNLKLVEEILLAIESEQSDVFVNLPSLKEYTPKQIIEYHIYLLLDAGLIIGGKINPTSTPKDFRLTKQGHDYLEAKSKGSMKRNSKLEEEILSAIEFDQSDVFVPLSSLNEYTPEQVGYHVKFLSEAGYILGMKMNVIAPRNDPRNNFRLTWLGHDYLEHLQKTEKVEE